MGTVFFPGGKERPRRDSDHSPLLMPWSRKSRAIPLRLLWTVGPVQSLSVCTRVKFIFTFPHLFPGLFTSLEGAHWAGGTCARSVWMMWRTEELFTPDRNRIPEFNSIERFKRLRGTVKVTSKHEDRSSRFLRSTGSDEIQQPCIRGLSLLLTALRTSNLDNQNGNNGATRINMTLDHFLWRTFAHGCW